MKSLIKKVIKTLHLDRYLSTKIVLLMDVVVSAAASVLTMIMVGLILNAQQAASRLIVAWLSLSVVASIIAFLLLRTYRTIIRHSTIREFGRFVLSTIVKEGIILSYILFSFSEVASWKLFVVTAAVDLCLTIVLLMGVRALMVVVYDLIRSKILDESDRQNVLLYGTHEESIALSLRFRDSKQINVVGFLIKGERHLGIFIDSKKVYFYSTQEDLSFLRSRNIHAILFASRADAVSVEDELLTWLPKIHIKSLIAPPLDEMVDGRIPEKSIRSIKIEDLLGREEIKINMTEIINNFRGKVVMVTGAAGSIGSELCRQLASFEVKQLILFDNAETPMHNLRLELEKTFPHLDFVPVIGDVRYIHRLDFAFRTYRPQVLFHAAAYKHVPLMEENPCEAVLVNVAGTRYVADKCIEYGVEKMVMISTDKAVNPTNIMGCTKRLAEIYVQSLGLAIQNGSLKGKTKFVTTRFGNVLGSNGSVIPLFREQLSKGGPLTVTHPDIVRYFMTIPEACRLVMEAATMTGGNEIFVFDMGECVRIADLAVRMIELAGLEPGKDIQIEYIGLRPGEKLYEEVLSSTENTIPTEHERIRIAKVREYEYDQALHDSKYLEDYSINIEISEMVSYMKKVVPEYKSKNSEFEKYDSKDA